MESQTCQACGGSMRLLLFSWYCPNDCDRRVIKASVGYHVVERSDGKWRVTVLKNGDIAPDWVRYAWSLVNYDGDPVKTFLKIFSSGKGWDCTSEYLQGIIDNSSSVYLAMAPES